MKRSDFFIMKAKDSLDKTQYEAGMNIQMKGLDFMHKKNSFPPINWK